MTLTSPLDVRSTGPGTPRVLDLSTISTLAPESGKKLPRFENGRVKSMDPKQIRARARRATRVAKEDLALLQKPVEEWDEEELARGRPRDKNGGFSGATPSWISRKVHEEAVARFTSLVKSRMHGSTLTATDVVHQILNDAELDRRGRPYTPASTKLDAAKFLIEHVVGKPRQRVETDISVRLQQVLAAAIVVPGQLPAPTSRQTEAGHAPSFELAQGYADVEEAELVDDDSPDEGW